MTNILEGNVGSDSQAKIILRSAVGLTLFHFNNSCGFICILFPSWRCVSCLCPFKQKEILCSSALPEGLGLILASFLHFCCQTLWLTCQHACSQLRSSSSGAFRKAAWPGMTCCLKLWKVKLVSIKTKGSYLSYFKRNCHSVSSMTLAQMAGLPCYCSARENTDLESSRIKSENAWQWKGKLKHKKWQMKEDQREKTV